jgi:hypothetical protein
MPEQELTYHFDGLGLTELCEVTVCDEPQPFTNGHHLYRFRRRLTQDDACRILDGEAVSAGFIQFQRGARVDPGATPGVLDGAVLSVLIHRQESFQAGPCASPEGDQVLYHLREALNVLVQRALRRAERGVLGTNVK